MIRDRDENREDDGVWMMSINKCHLRATRICIVAFALCSIGSRIKCGFGGADPEQARLSEMEICIASSYFLVFPTLRYTQTTK